MRDYICSRKEHLRQQIASVHDEKKPQKYSACDHICSQNNEGFENKFVNSLGYTFSNDLCQSAKLSSASLGTGQANFVAEIRYGL